jgi:hypothetical protein
MDCRVKPGNDSCCVLFRAIIITYRSVNFNSMRRLRR